MEKSKLDQVISEVGEYYKNNGTKLAPAEAFHAASSYSDPAWLEKEREVLRRYPVIVGHSSRIKAAGDFFTDDLAGVPIIVVRQNDGSVRALINVCRHRGAKVCTEASGTRRNFVCPYHAWSYRTDGSLLKIPREEAFPNLNTQDHGLAELPVEERHGFIWVVATPGATIDVAAHLGGIDAELASYKSADMVLERDTVLSEDINWKFVLDGFLEVYHFASLHSKTIAPYFHGQYSPYDEFGMHGRLIGVRKSFDAVRGNVPEDAEASDLIKHFAMNYLIFPNTVLVWQADHFECWTAFPGEQADKCKVRVQSITTKEMSGPDYTSRWDKNWKIMIGTVIAEDWAVSKTIQQSLHAVPENQLVFGRNEPGMQHFHGQMRKEITGE
ncbi:MAG: aromatic ring-hydroxylating dioxygenase subunit alpha [Pseudomonadota bacterium]